MATNKERIETNNAKIETLTTLVAQKSQGEKGLQTVKGFVENTLTSFNCKEFGITTIPQYKFYYNTGLQTVDLTGVTSIGRSAFQRCSNLTNFIIPSSVTNIDNNAFSNCTSLTSITIPSSVTSIGNAAFSSCTGLTSVIISDDVTSIGDNAFYSCSGLTSVEIGSVISYGMFQNCSSLTSVTIPDGVTSIGDYAFRDCSSLTSVTIPDSVASIGSYAFFECTSLSNITIPNSVTSIGEQAFRNCLNVSQFNCSAKLTSLGSNTFYSMGNSRTNTDWFIFNFKNSVFTSIASNNFSSPYNLSKTKYFRITFPTTLTAISGTYNWSSTDHMYIYYNSKPTLSNTNNFANSATNFKNFFLYNDFVSVKSMTNWSSTTNNIVNSIYGYAPENTFESGATLPTTDESGNALTWYDDEEMTNVVTEVGEANQIYYCTQAV